MANLNELAKGRWPAILEAVGIEKRFLVNRHGPCPICEGGRDRFRFDDKDGKGTWFCNQCGAGDGVSLVMKTKGWSFIEAKRAIEPLCGVVPQTTVRQGPPEAKVRQQMNWLWKAAKPVAEIGAARRWWERRLGYVPVTTELRALDALDCPRHGTFPGMIARLLDPAGKPVQLHRTFLQTSGEKAKVPSPRMVMPLDMPRGAAVRLQSPRDGVLGIAEGIETAMCASALFDVPVWSTLNANSMKTWELPTNLDRAVERVIVFGDNDAGKQFTGQSAAYQIAEKLARAKVEVSVEVPEQLGQDWADVYAERRAESATTGEAA
jgi:putative DNA primase/helicase